MKPVTNEKQLSKLILRGYKSIAECDLELGSLNILIGANGSGKSNLISLFKMIPNMLEGNLQAYVSRQGGPDALLHFGRKKTPFLEIELYFGFNGYKCILEPTLDNRLMFSKEAFWWNAGIEKSLGRGHLESRAKIGTKTHIDDYVFPAMVGWRLYHFHDTSETAYVKQVHNINDYTYLRHDGRNLAAFLYFLKKSYTLNYQQIVKAIQLVAPFFGDFELRPISENQETIKLEWTQKGEDIPFGASQLSDGTLRFICLVTVLLQPEELRPATIIIDEPELGLHPYAIVILSSLIKAASTTNQIIISTQSVELLDQFDVGDVIVAEMKDNKSQLIHLNKALLTPWLDDYSLGELWKKNVFGGRPSK